MIQFFIALTAVAVNFGLGFSAAKVINRPKKSAAPKCENEVVTARHIAEYRNFLCYDGTEQDEIE